MYVLTIYLRYLHAKDEYTTTSKPRMKKTAKKEKVKDEVNLRWSLRWTTTGADSWPWICVLTAA